jgi:hypothetical protein
MASKRTPQPSRADLIRAFDAAPDSALFDQTTVAAVKDCSTAKLERDRWAGTGIPYVKDGWRVRYRKSDVLAALAALPAYRSTSEDPETARRSRQRTATRAATSAPAE